MKRLLLGMVVILFASALGAQNWDIDVLHKVNSWDNKFVRNYNKVISKSEPYVAIGVPVAMAVAGWIRHDKDLLKDALYVGTSVAGAFVVTYGMKYLVDRERPMTVGLIVCTLIVAKAVLLFRLGIRRQLLPWPLP